MMLIVLVHMSEGTPNNPYVNTTLSEIAQRAGCGRITAHKHAKSLEVMGVIRKVNQYKNGGCIGSKFFLNVDVIRTGKISDCKKKRGENV